MGMNSSKGSSKEKDLARIKEPKRYNVIMFNDDFTTMEFVVEVLVDIFHMDEITAEEVMMTVHKSGKAVIGTFPKDIALTRVDMALRRARNEGFPFRMTVEEA